MKTKTDTKNRRAQRSNKQVNNLKKKVSTKQKVFEYSAAALFLSAIISVLINL